MFRLPASDSIHSFSSLNPDFSVRERVYPACPERSRGIPAAMRAPNMALAPEAAPFIRAPAFGRWLLALFPPLALARRHAFGRSRFPIFLWMNAQLMPRRLRKIDAIMLRRFLDVRESQCPIRI